jgi:CHAT domain-containing protein
VVGNRDDADHHVSNVSSLRRLTLRWLAKMTRHMAGSGEQIPLDELALIRSAAACSVMIESAAEPCQRSLAPEAAEFETAFAAFDDQADFRELAMCGALYARCLGQLGRYAPCLAIGARCASALMHFDDIRALEARFLLTSAMTRAGEILEEYEMATRYRLTSVYLEKELQGRTPHIETLKYLRYKPRWLLTLDRTVARLNQFVESIRRGLNDAMPWRSYFSTQKPWHEIVAESDRLEESEGFEKALYFLKNELARREFKLWPFMFLYKRQFWHQYAVFSLRKGQLVQRDDAHALLKLVLENRDLLKAFWFAHPRGFFWELVNALDYSIRVKFEPASIQRYASIALSEIGGPRGAESLRWRALLPMVFSFPKGSAESVLFGKLAIDEVVAMTSSVKGADSSLGTTEGGFLAALFNDVVGSLVHAGRLAEAALIMSCRRQNELLPFVYEARSSLLQKSDLFVGAEREAAKSYYATRTAKHPADVEASFLEMRRALASSINTGARTTNEPFLVHGNAAAHLADDQALLHFMPSRDRVVISAHTRHSQFAALSEISATSLNHLIFFARQKVRALMPIEGIGELRTLYDCLIRPVLKELSSSEISRLMLAPSGALDHLPFAMLFDGTQWLAQQYALARAPVGGESLRARPRSPVSAFVGGCSRGEPGICPPLKHVATEIDGIEAAAQGAIGIHQVVDPDFTWNRLRSGLSKGSVVHLAGHCIVDPVMPRKSRLLLSDGGSVKLEQIALAANRPDLVVLSACETGGVGSDIAPESQLPFDRFFVESGAHSLICTAWPVNDAAQAALMPRFYAHLFRDGLPKDVSLAKAQRAMMSGELRDVERTHNWKHPYYWAGVSLTGNCANLIAAGDRAPLDAA